MFKALDLVCRILLCIHDIAVCISLHMTIRLCLACKLHGTAFLVQKCVHHTYQLCIMYRVNALMYHEFCV